MLNAGAPELINCSPCGHAPEKLEVIVVSADPVAVQHYPADELETEGAVLS